MKSPQLILILSLILATLCSCNSTPDSIQEEFKSGTPNNYKTEDDDD